MLSTVDVGFISISAYVITIGYIIIKYEKNIPAFLIRSFKYGSFCYKGPGGSFVGLTEVPKVFFKHYYFFSSVFSVIIFAYVLSVYLFHRPVDEWFTRMLKMVSKTSEPTVSAGAALLTLLLVVIQCCRRYHEVYHLQVFSSSARMNISHYVVGFYHYFGVVLGAVAEAPLFCGDQDRRGIQWLDSRTAVLAGPCVAVFAWAWAEQYRSNVILANLRRDKKGEVITEEYKIPRGGLFELVSSPHRLTELVVYLVLLILTPTTTYFCIFVWVVGNQVLGAVYTHEWYRNTFKDYPDNRQAIFPGVL